MLNINPAVTSGSANNPVTTLNSILLFGDSMIDHSFPSIAVTGDVTDNGDGTATMVITTPKNYMAVGDTIRVNGSATPKNNQLSATIIAISGNNVTYTNTGPAASLVMSGTVLVYLPYNYAMGGFYPFLQFLSGGCLDLAYSYAQGGTYIENQLELLTQTPPISPVRFGIFCSGANNIYALGDSLSTLKTKAKNAIDLLRQYCLYFVAVTVPPRVHTDGSWTTGKMQIHLQYNAWLKDYVKSVGGYVVESSISSSAGVQYRDPNPAVTNGDPTANWSADGVHPSGISAYALGKNVWNTISGVVLQTTRFPSCAAQGYTNDPSFLSDYIALTGIGGTKTPGSGTITGNVPDGCTLNIVAGTATVTTSQIARTVAADGDGYGNWFRMTVTNLAGVTSHIKLTIPLTAARLLFSKYIRPFVRINLTSSATPGSGNPSGLIGLNLISQIIYNPASGAETQQFNSLGTNVAVAQALNEGFSGVLTTEWGITKDSSHGPVSSGTAIWIDMYIQDANGFTLDVAHPMLKQYTV